MTISSQPRFAVGDRVRVRLDNPEGHSRAPAFTRGRAGTVERWAGRFPHPAGLARIQPAIENDDLYTVAFDASALFGAEGRAGDRVFVDLYGSYLEPL